jgi:regulator of sigma E protease
MLVYFLIVITLLVMFHELGHYLAARALGVKVLCFSIGFGKQLFGFTSKGGTLFKLSLIPLGGYVRLLGDDVTKGALDEQRAFCNQPLLKRFIIIIAGPIFNFLLAFLLLWLMFQMGVYALTPIVGGTMEDSIAEKSGFERLDRIKAVENKDIHSWSQFHKRLLTLQSELTKATVTVQDRNGKKLTRTLPIEKVLSSKAAPFPQSLGFEFYLPELPAVIGEVVKDSPAYQVGLQPGDRILTINQQTITNWQGLATLLAKSEGDFISLTVLRSGKRHSFALARDNLLKFSSDKKLLLGIKSPPPELPQGYVSKIHYGPIESISYAFSEMNQLLYMTLNGVKRLIFAEASLKELAGPVGIASEATGAASNGLSSFLFFLAIVSIGLGVLNLLPIPMLDGGHLMFIGYEAICGKAMSMELRQKFIMVGALFLCLLTIIAFSNDFRRLNMSENSYEVNRNGFK